MRKLTRRGLVLSALAGLACQLAARVDQHPHGGGRGEGPARIVATPPAIAELCDRLELELVGVCSTSRQLPARYEALPRVGSPMSPDLERLRGLHPSCVLSPSSLLPDLQPRYASIFVASMFLELRCVEGLWDSVEAVGRRFGREGQAAALRARHDDFMAGYRAGVEGRGAPRVLPLMGLPGSYVVATESSYAGSLVGLAGGANVYEGGDQEFIRANTEDMLLRDPDVILRASHALPDEVMRMFADEFSSNDIWRHFRAVRQGRVFGLPHELFGMSASFDYPQALEFLRPLLFEEG